MPGDHEVSFKDSISSPTLGYSFAITHSIAAALATVVGKWNLTAISPLLMNSLIFTIATVILSVTMLPRQGVRRVFCHNRNGWYWISLFTACSWLAIWAFWAGVQKIDPSLAAFLNRAEVLIAVLLGVIALKERFGWLETSGLLLSIAGIVVMRLYLQVECNTGFWLVLLGAFFFGITEFVSKLAVRYVQPIVLAYLRNMFMAAAYWLTFLISGESLDGIETVWPGVLALGFLGPIASRVMYLFALRRLSLSKVAVISQTQPIFVIAIALIALAKVPTLREIAGGILLTVGCLLMILGRPALRNGSNPSGQCTNKQ